MCVRKDKVTISQSGHGALSMKSLFVMTRLAGIRYDNEFVDGF